jgi:methylation protein EvaC
MQKANLPIIQIEYTTIDRCRSCDSSDLELLIDYGVMPLAGGFLRPEDIGTLNIAFPLRLSRCRACTLMQVLDTVPPEKIFTQYSYASSTTHTLIDHFAGMGPEIIEYAGAVGSLVIEFGCNDGVLMKPMIQAGARPIGVDPSDVALRASEKEGWLLIHDYFTESVAKQIVSEYGKARLVTGNNVFAHVPDIHGILRAVTTVLEQQGLFIFEVHYQGALVESIQFDTVYHEHIYYYSVTALQRLLGFHDLQIVDVKPIPIHAGSIRVTAARKESKWQQRSIVDQMLLIEKNLDIAGFVQKVQARRETIQKIVGDLNMAGRRVVAYGAAGRMTIMLNYCKLDQSLIEYVLDMSPLRYGKIVPGVMIPIVPPNVFHEHPPDYAIMTAWNYEREIIRKEQVYLSKGGRFIIPLPEIRIVGEI